MEKTITCTVCPQGCQINVIGNNGTIESITGFACNRGKRFATDEFIHPMRIFTSTMKINNFDEPLIPVRSDALVPKEKLFDCMKVVREKTVSAPIQPGQVLVANILNLGCNIIASKGTEI